MAPDPTKTGQTPKPDGVSLESVASPDKVQDTGPLIDDETRLNENLIDQVDSKTQPTDKPAEISTEETILQQETHYSPTNDNRGETLIEAAGFKPETLAEDTPPKVGDLLNKQYRLEKQLGQGGMGSVFKALDLTKQEVHAKNLYVAIKLLLPELAKDESLVRTFHREAEKAQQLTHPNIIKVFVANRDNDRHYMVMEYLEGEPLNRIIRDHGAITLAKAWPIIRDMGLGLAHAHERNIIHRDFKPANVFMLEKTGEVKILDFGIAAELKQTGDQEVTIFGGSAQDALTTAYASFEMLSGARKADPRDDIYAFGLVVYELLTGQHPYNRKPATEIYHEKKQGIHQQPAHPPGLNKKQWQLLSQAIAIEQEHRPAKLQDWLKEFDPEHNKAPVWQNILMPAIILAVILAVGGYLWQTQETKTDNGDKAKTPSISDKPRLPALPGPPVANAGNDQQVSIGQSVTLNGNASQAADGGPLNYAWQLIAQPERSTSALTGASTVNPKLLPDQPGIYRAQLTVTDAHKQSSQPVTVQINAAAPRPKLNLKTSQSQYIIGQYLQINIQPTEDGYLGIVYISSIGEKLQIFPNGYQENSQVKAGQSFQVPPKKKRDMLQIQGPEGTDTLVAVFSKQRLPELEPHINNDGTLTGLQQDTTVEQIQYQVIKNKN